MDPPPTQYVVTPWRDSSELLQLRHDLYGSDSTKKEKAVNKVFAWRLRKPEGLPLLLESTADIVDVLLQDEKNDVNHNALRLLYAAALSRFITGLADTQTELLRDKPSWFPSGKSFQLPLPLLEIRHRIVHRHLPSLAELKRAAQGSLDYLWDWYWSQLDHAFGIAKNKEDNADVESSEAIKDKLQAILKAYVKERKTEIKARRKDPQAAANAISTYNMRYAPDYTSTPSSRTQSVLLRLLAVEKMILPAEKKLGSTMSGAFLIWDPLLHMFCRDIVPVSDVLKHLMNAMNASSAARAVVATDSDPVKEGLYEWISHILSSDDWITIHKQQVLDLVEDTLIQCFSQPTHWNVKVAETVLQDDGVANREHWLAVLAAAQSEEVDDVMNTTADEMDTNVEQIVQGLPVAHEETSIVKGKWKGPRKAAGMWKPRPVGWVPEGWEDDD